MKSLENRMKRLEGMAHKIKNMSRDNEPLDDILHQMKTFEGILTKAKQGLLQHTLQDVLTPNDSAQLLMRISQLGG